MLNGQVVKGKLYSDRVSFRVPKFIFDYVKYNVQLSNVSRNRWLSETIVNFCNRIVSPESPVNLTED